MWQIFRAIVLFTAMVPASLHAATIPISAENGLDRIELFTPWRNPGRNPCRGSAECTPAWAVNAMHEAGAIPLAVREKFLALEAQGEPRVGYWIQSGDEIRVNSYAKDGVPYIQQYMRAEFADEMPRRAYGHSIYHQNTWYDVVLVAECGNWVLLVHPPRVDVPAQTTIPKNSLVSQSYGNQYYGASPSYAAYIPGSFGGGGGQCLVCEYHETPEVPPITPPSDNPPVIPLPASVWLSLTALLTLGLSGYLTRRQCGFR